MQVNSVNSTTRAANTGADEQTPLANKKQVLGQEDFLKLLAVQFQSQDPMKPMEDTAFIAQMAQFSALQQSTQMSAEITRLRSDSQMQAASGMIGREVTVAMPDGDVTGVVDGVASDGDGMHVRIGETYYPFALIYRVSAPTPPAPTETPESPAAEEPEAAESPTSETNPAPETVNS